MILSLLRYLIEYLLKDKKKLGGTLDKRLCESLDRGINIPLIIFIIFLIR